MKIKLMLGLLFLGILVLAAAGFALRRSRRALRVVLQPAGRVRPADASALSVPA